jgi:hypothetical protein
MEDAKKLARKRAWKQQRRVLQLQAREALAGKAGE